MFSFLGIFFGDCWPFHFGKSAVSFLAFGRTFSRCTLSSQSAAGDVYVPLNIADWMIPTDPAPFPLLLFDLKADAVAQTAVCMHPSVVLEIFAFEDAEMNEARETNFHSAL